MICTEIEIKEYKSIKKPVKISFSESLPTVLVGKNGSGKSNILEALNGIASFFSRKYSKEKVDFTATVKLTNDDILFLFPGKSLDMDKCILTVSPENENLKITSPYLVPYFKASFSELTILIDELSSALDIFKKQITKVCLENDPLPITCVEVDDSTGSTTNLTTISCMVDRFIEQAKSIVGPLLSSFKDDDSLIFSNEILYHNLKLNPDFKKIKSIKLRYKEPELAAFETKYISIDKAGIKREIAKINRSLYDSAQKIEKMLNSVESLSIKFASTFSSDRYSFSNPNNYYKLNNEIRNSIAQNVSQLKNENSFVIFKDRDNENGYYWNDNTSAIFNTFIMNVYSGSDKEDLLSASGSDSFKPSKQSIEEFEKYLNTTLPEFEKGMYNSISVKHLDKRSFEINLYEKTGEIINLNSSSTGRRWYFTYFFMKSTLRPGDMFIIDEPAAMLHPSAQKEVLQDLIDLCQQGVKVIYSTHSPYLVPKEWKSVHYISITNDGTEVTPINSLSSECEELKDWVDDDIVLLQEIIDKFNISDPVLVAHNCYRAIKKHYGNVEAAATALGLSEDTFKAWNAKTTSNRFRSPELTNIIKVSINTKTDILDLL